MRKRAARVPIAVRDAIQDAAKDYRLRNLVPNAAEIHRKLLPLYKEDVPSERTIRKIASDDGPDKSGAWRATASKVDARLVLPVLAVLIERGTREQLSVNEAEVIAMVYGAVPNTPPLFAWMLAKAYLAPQAADVVDWLANLDALLAFAPWTSVAAQQRFMNVIAEGRVRDWLTWPDPPDATPRKALWGEIAAPVKQRRTRKGQKGSE